MSKSDSASLVSPPGSKSEQPLTGAMLFLLAGLAALGTLATNIILPAFPEIGADLGVSERDLALTLSSFFIAFAVGQLFVGPLSDRFGRKWLVLGGLATFIAGSVLCALAVSLDMMILGRLIQALGACAASVLSRAIARDLFDGEALARALALVMVAMAAAPGFSPLVGNALANYLVGSSFLRASPCSRLCSPSNTRSVLVRRIRRPDASRCHSGPSPLPTAGSRSIRCSSCPPYR